MPTNDIFTTLLNIYPTHIIISKLNSATKNHTERAYKNIETNSLTRKSIKKFLEINTLNTNEIPDHIKNGTKSRRNFLFINSKKEYFFTSSKKKKPDMQKNIGM